MTKDRVFNVEKQNHNNIINEEKNMSCYQNKKNVFK